MINSRHAIIACLLALVGCAATEVATAGPRRGCAQGRTLLQTDQLRIFRSSRARDVRVYGCLNGHRPIRHLGFAPGMTAMAGAGHFFANAYEPFEGFAQPVVVRNVHIGRALWHYYAPYAPGCPAQCPSDYEQSPEERALGVSSLVVTRRGRAAWIEGWALPDGRTRYDVIRTFRPAKWEGAMGHQGETEMVDWGTNVDQASLHMTGTTVTWTKAGVEHSADLS